MAFERHNFLHIVLFLLFELCKLERSSTDILLSARNLVVQVLVLLTDLLNRVLKPLVLLAGVAVVLQNVFFLKFEGPSYLLGFALLVNKGVVLAFEQLIRVRGLAKLLVDEPVFAS